MKKRKLKRWVKVVLFIMGVLLFYKALDLGISLLEKTARECDEYYGYTCDLNLVDKFGKGIKYERWFWEIFKSSSKWQI